MYGDTRYPIFCSSTSSDIVVALDEDKYACPRDQVRIYYLERAICPAYDKDPVGHWKLETELMSVPYKTVIPLDSVSDGVHCKKYVVTKNLEIDITYAKMLIDAIVRDERHKAEDAMKAFKDLQCRAADSMYMLWEHLGGGNYELKLTYKASATHEQLELPLVFD